MLDGERGKVLQLRTSKQSGGASKMKRIDEDWQWFSGPICCGT